MPDEVASPPVTQEAPPQASPSQPIGQVAGTGVEGVAQATPPPPQPLDPAYVAKGQKWKLSEDDLRQIPQHVFDRLNAAADNEILESLALADMRAGGDPRAQQPQYQAPPQAQPVQYAPDDPFAPLAVKYGEDEPDDAPYRQHIEGVVGWANRAVQAMVNERREERKQIGDAFQQMRDANDLNILDHHIASWGDEWSDVFGKGPNFVLNPNSQEFQRRGAVLTAAKRLIELDVRLGRPVNVGDVLLRARAQQFSDKQAEITRAAQEKKLKAVQAQLPPATNRMGGFAAAGTNGSVRTSDAEFLSRVRGG